MKETTATLSTQTDRKRDEISDEIERHRELTLRCQEVPVAKLNKACSTRFWAPRRKKRITWEAIKIKRAPGKKYANVLKDIQTKAKFDNNCSTVESIQHEKHGRCPDRGQRQTVRSCLTRRWSSRGPLRRQRCFTPRFNIPGGDL